MSKTLILLFLYLCCYLQSVFLQRKDPTLDLSFSSLFKHQTHHQRPGDFKLSINKQNKHRLNPEERQYAENIANNPESRNICDCGIQQFVPHRIYGGIETYPNEYPWMIGLLFPPGTIACGATLISNKFALSAAHCFLYPVSSIFALMGVHDLRFISPNAVIVPVVQIITHPMFNRTTADNDIAIVEFQFPIVFTPNISPICLPFPNMDLTWQTVITMGWGLTQFAPSSATLQEITLIVSPNDVCQQQYGPGSPITERMLCAYGDGKDACRGDSGGPLIWNFQGRWYIAGIVSFGMQCGTATSAGVYTRVDRFVQWISSETEQTACLAPAVVLTTIPYPWLLTRSTSAGTSSGPDATSFIRAGKQDKELETTFK